MYRRLAALVAVWGVALVGPVLAGPAAPVALGHAQLLTSIPGAGHVEAEKPRELRLVFSEPLEPAFSHVDLLDPDGTTVLRKAGAPDPADPYSLVVPLPELRDGVYTVNWTSLSTADGHTASAFFTFGVGNAAPQVPTAEQAGGMHAGHGAGLVLIEIQSRAASYLGLLLAFGLPLIGWLVLRRPVSPDAIAAALGVAAIGSVGVLYVSSQTALTEMMTYATTGRSGQLFLARIAVAAAGAGIVFLLGRLGRAQVAGIAGGMAGLLGLLIVAISGHAAAYASPAPVVAIVVHLIAVGTWLSGVAVLAWLALAPDLAPAPMRELVPRFSGLALIAGGLLGLSGLYSDWVQTRNLLDFGTPYTATLLLKIVLVGAALSLGAVNFFSRGGEFRFPIPFGARVGLEAALAVAVVLATGNLTSGSPPAQVQPIEIAQTFSSATALGDGSSLALQPGRPGPINSRRRFATPATWRRWSSCSSAPTRTSASRGSSSGRPATMCSSPTADSSSQTRSGRPR